MISAGIVDPTKVTRSALQNASSVAAMVLTTESLWLQTLKSLQLLLLLLILVWAVCINLKLLIKSHKKSAIPDLVWQIFYVYN